MTHVIMFNGPPGSGKDLFANAVYNRYSNVKRFKFKQPIIDALSGFLSLDPKQWKELDSEGVKERPHPYMLNQVPRKAQISFSEDFAKPIFGDKVFGQLLWDRIMSSPCKIAVVSDCGFESEVSYITRVAGKDMCMLVRLSRDGCTFEGDSRSYIPDIPGVTTVDINNNLHTMYDRDMFDLRIRKLVEGFVEGSENWRKNPVI